VLKMMIRILETGELKDLTIRDKNGIEWTKDLMGDDDNLKYNYDDDVYELPKESFVWWDEYITNKIVDDEEIEELAEEYGDVVYERLANVNIAKWMTNTYICRRSSKK